jgi:hypothetical protein
MALGGNEIVRCPYLVLGDLNLSPAARSQCRHHRPAIKSVKRLPPLNVKYDGLLSAWAEPMPEVAASRDVVDVPKAWKPGCEQADQKNKS